MTLENYIDIDPIQEIMYHINKELRKSKQVTIYYNTNDAPYIRLNENVLYTTNDVIAEFIEKLKKKHNIIEYAHNSETALTILL
jgi:hypothetical protein